METLQNFLRNTFLLDVSSKKDGLDSSKVEQAIKRSTSKKAKIIEYFDIPVSVVPETMQENIKAFYYPRGYTDATTKLVYLSHNGFDLSFEKDRDYLFVVISQFNDFYRISVAEILR